MDTKALTILRCLDFINCLLFQRGYISGTRSASVPRHKVGETPVQPVSQKQLLPTSEPVPFTDYLYGVRSHFKPSMLVSVQCAYLYPPT
jgi:hypothetical protein